MIASSFVWQQSDLRSVLKTTIIPEETGSPSRLHSQSARVDLRLSELACLSSRASCFLARQDESPPESPNHPDKERR